MHDPENHTRDPLASTVKLFKQDPLLFTVKALLFADVCAIFLGITSPISGTAIAIALYEIGKVLQE